MITAALILALQAVPPASPNTLRAEPPWFARLGLRSLEVQAQLPVLDQVVLVPDEATFLDEVSRWTPAARWPVLIEDLAFAPRFVRAFNPSAVYRRASVGAAPTGAALQAAVERAVAQAWGGDPSAGVAAALNARNLTPQGLVGASAADPAWPAALALAAGRGQLVAWVDGSFGSPNAVLDAPTFQQLDAAVRKAFEQSGFRWNVLGDELETFTLCRNTAYRVNLPSPPGGWDPRLPPRDPAPLAVTDALCRTEAGARYAFAAQIPGDAVRSSSMAMCSLFLARTTVWMWDGYADRKGNMFAEFGFAQAASQLSAAGFTCQVNEGANAAVTSWKSMLPTGVNADVLLVNSSGNWDFFQLAREQQLWATDVPLLQKPAVLSMVHSFSLQLPERPDSIGARWLDHGVYAYAGSVQEPYLPAFVPPRVLADRLLSTTPFLVASRHWPGDVIPQVWRIATVGDPLMTLPTPAVAKGLGARKPAEPPPGATELHAEARQAMEATRTATSAAPYAAAMRALVQMGDDRVAAQFWAVAQAKGQAKAVASAALGSLFRMRQRDAFTAAWQLVDAPTAEQRDMLWAMWGPELPRLTDKAVVAVLRKAVRGPRTDMDAEALLPAVRRAEGRDAAAGWLNDLLKATDDAGTKRNLAALQGKI